MRYPPSRLILLYNYPDRLDETEEDAKQGVYNSLQIIENPSELMPAMLETMCEKTSIVSSHNIFCSCHYCMFVLQLIKNIHMGFRYVFPGQLFYDQPSVHHCMPFLVDLFAFSG